MNFMQSWILPKISPADSIKRPAIGDTIPYLSAFFHNLPVKQFHNPPLTFTRWSSTSRNRNRIALSTPTTATLIRSRPSPDHLFTGQLNLSDLIDAILPILPADAYTLLLLVSHDIYEEDTDVFVCGRAYGASRVAVVSTARYNPALDDKLDVDRLHAWPASHCARYLDEMCGFSHPLHDVEQQQRQQRQQRGKRALRPRSTKHTEHGTTPSNPIDLTTPSSSPATSRLLHPTANPSPPPLPPASPNLHPNQNTNTHTLWLTRLFKPLPHELLHCFALDHCVYHACVMQASASLSEDARQPPFLCPVDVRKLSRAIGEVCDGGVGEGGRDREREWMRERYVALMGVCEGWNGGGDGGGGMFEAMAEWCRGVLAFMDAREE